MSHIALMGFSLVTTIGMVTVSILGTQVPKKLRQVNLTATILGVILGSSLLIMHPIGSRCIELTAYVVVFALLYRYVGHRSEKLATLMTSK